MCAHLFFSLVDMATPPIIGLVTSRVPKQAYCHSCGRSVLSSCRVLILWDGVGERPEFGERKVPPFPDSHKSACRFCLSQLCGRVVATLITGWPLPVPCHSRADHRRFLAPIYHSLNRSGPISLARDTIDDSILLPSASRACRREGRATLAS